MKTIQIKLTLQEPLVISQSNATEGAHQSLDYLPGATLLGAMAAKHYVTLKAKNLAYDIFHSGKVRFQNAYPLIDNKPSKPMPLSLHFNKLGEKLEPLNYLHKVFEKGEQGKQHRKGYITKSNSTSFIYEPSKTLKMRTAIDAKKGTAQEGQLFGYQMLQAGESFIANIDCDDEALASSVCSILNQQNEILIGRSRSAQYGRVSLEVLPTASKSITAPVIKIKNKNCLVLWLASDMAVYNKQGQPTLSPTLLELGLSDCGSFDSSKSFVRTRKYAPYNGFRRSYDLERQVLAKGSILTYELSTDLTDNDLKTLSEGLGAYTESGLGQVVLDEAILGLQDSQTKLTEWKLVSSKSGMTLKTTDLIQYLKMKSDEAKASGQYALLIDEQLEALSKLYKSARNFNGAQKGATCGPTKTQWGMVRQAATNADGAQTLFDSLFHEKNGAIRAQDEHWSVSTGSKSFMSYLQAITKENNPQLLRALAFKVTQNKELLNLMEGKV
jgi:CRISPR-associated protein Csx10